MFQFLSPYFQICHCYQKCLLVLSINIAFPDNFNLQTTDYLLDMLQLLKLSVTRIKFDEPRTSYFNPILQFQIFFSHYYQNFLEKPSNNDGSEEMMLLKVLKRLFFTLYRIFLFYCVSCQSNLHDFEYVFHQLLGCNF